MSSIDQRAAQRALEKLKAEIKLANSTAVDGRRPERLKILEELLKEQMPYENTYPTAR